MLDIISRISYFTRMDRKMTAHEALDLIKDELKNVESALIANIDTKVSLITEVVTYILSGGGKRLRPAFLCLAAKMCGYKGDKCPDISAVIEYIHTATLLHDDIVDGAKYRRNKPSANVRYGNDIAVLCGDFLYSRAYTILTEHGDKNVQRIISQAALIMSEGEVTQLLKTSDVSITMDEYLQIIRRKTAVLFSAACVAGARLAGMSDEKSKTLHDFGHYLGLAFQMTDDILDYTGNAANMGKNPGTDLYEGKLTLPLIILLQKCNDLEKKEISNIFAKNKREENDLANILTLLAKYNIKTESEIIVDGYIELSLANLSTFPDNEYKEGLKAIAASLIGREK